MSAPRVVLAGVGLMGGSLGLALRKNRRAHVVGLCRTPAAVRRAERARAVDEATTDLRQALVGADILILAAPVDALESLGRRLAPHTPPTALVMDVGSVKGAVVAALAPLFEKGGATFLGAHPMAGSEKTGVENASATLYQGATCVLTPTVSTPPAALRLGKSFWRHVGARVVEMSPTEHDRAVALVSHVPHAIAETLCLAAAQWGRTPAERRRLQHVVAGSFRDATRVAEADPALWRGIFWKNETAVKEAVTHFEKTLRTLVTRRWPIDDLRTARRIARAWRNS